jgi:hypothetical protein
MLLGTNETLVEAGMRSFKCPIYTHHDVNAKFSTSGDETYYIAGILKKRDKLLTGEEVRGGERAKSYDVE